MASSRSHSDVRSVSLDAASVSKYRAFHSILSRAVCGDMAVVRLVTFWWVCNHQFHYRLYDIKLSICRNVKETCTSRSTKRFSCFLKSIVFYILNCRFELVYNVDTFRLINGRYGTHRKLRYVGTTLIGIQRFFFELFLRHMRWTCWCENRRPKWWCLTLNWR